MHNRIVAQLGSFRRKAFRVVTEHLNFHKAAEQLFLTEPAATVQIEAAESKLGEPLFDRTGGKVSLTRQGSILPCTLTKSRQWFSTRATALYRRPLEDTLALAKSLTSVEVAVMSLSRTRANGRTY